MLQIFPRPAALSHFLGKDAARNKSQLGHKIRLVGQNFFIRLFRLFSSFIPNAFLGLISSLPLVSIAFLILPWLEFSSFSNAPSLPSDGLGTLEHPSGWIELPSLWILTFWKIIRTLLDRMTTNYNILRLNMDSVDQYCNIERCTVHYIADLWVWFGF